MNRSTSKLSTGSFEPLGALREARGKGSKPISAGMGFLAFDPELIAPGLNLQLLHLFTKGVPIDP